jgi:hypothetical protein
LALVFGMFTSSSASAGQVFSFFLDENGFTSPLAPFPPIIGTGELDLSSNVADGTYTLNSLPSFTLSFSFPGGPSFTEADIVSDPTQAEVVVYNGGQNAYFSDITPDGITGGSLTLINPGQDLLTFSPAGFPEGFYILDVREGPFFEGNYGNAVVAVPEPSSLSILGVCGAIAGILTLARRRRAA